MRQTCYLISSSLTGHLLEWFLPYSVCPLPSETLFVKISINFQASSFQKRCLSRIKSSQFTKSHFSFSSRFRLSAKLLNQIHCWVKVRENQRFVVLKALMNFKTALGFCKKKNFFFRQFFIFIFYFLLFYFMSVLLIVDVFFFNFFWCYYYCHQLVFIIAIIIIRLQLLLILSPSYIHGLNKYQIVCGLERVFFFPPPNKLSLPYCSFSLSYLSL